MHLFHCVVKNIHVVECVQIREFGSTTTANDRKIPHSPQRNIWYVVIQKIGGFKNLFSVVVFTYNNKDTILTHANVEPIKMSFPIELTVARRRLNDLRSIKKRTAVIFPFSTSCSFDAISVVFG